jgi:hypothetical protein
MEEENQARLRAQHTLEEAIFSSQTYVSTGLGLDDGTRTVIVPKSLT